MRRDYVLSLITPVIGNKDIANDVVDVLVKEDLINIHYGNEDVSEIVNTFKEVFGITKTSKYDRFAAKRLADKHGTDSIVQIIKLIAQRSSEQFCPTIGSVQQLETKWVSVIRFLRGNRGFNNSIEIDL